MLKRLCWDAAESPDNHGKRRLRSSSKADAGASSPAVGEELQVRRSKRKSRQTVESSDDDGDGHPATKRHLDLQAADDKVFSLSMLLSHGLDMLDMVCCPLPCHERLGMIKS